MRDGQRESDRDGGIDGVASGLENLDANIGREGFLRDHHGTPGADRLMRAELDADEQGQNKGKASHDVIVLRLSVVRGLLLFDLLQKN